MSAEPIALARAGRNDLAVARERFNRAVAEVHAALSQLQVAAVGATMPVLPRKVLVRVPEAAEMLGVSRATIYRLIQQGKLETVRQGGATCIRVADIESYAASL